MVQERGLMRIFSLILWTISNKIGGLEEVKSSRFVYIMIKNLSILIFSARNIYNFPDEDRA